MRWWYRLWKTLLHVWFSICFDMRLLGRENVPLDGPVLLVCNHQSFLDPPMVGMALGRECDFIARQTLFDNPVFGWFIRSVNSFPVQGEGELATIRTIIRRLQNNRAVVLFPEGVRSPDGRIGALQKGFEVIARRGDAATVPVVIEGAYDAWPRHQRHINLRKPIHIMYGKPVSAAELKAMSRDEFLGHITGRLQQMQARLRQQLGKAPFAYRDDD